MTEKARLWEIGPNDRLIEIPGLKLDTEDQIHNWLESDISMLADDLLVIGREVTTDYGKSIDLLCLQRSGNLVVVELKRDRTPREVLAQTIDYASWVRSLPPDRVQEIAQDYFRKKGWNKSLEDAFKEKFGVELPEAINEDHQMYVVASELDSSAERGIDYLSSYGVPVNGIEFQYHAGNGKRYLSRIFVVEPEQADVRSKSRAGQRLTDSQLDEAADENGVGTLYLTAVAGLTLAFKRRNGSSGKTKSSRTFGGPLNGENVTIMSLLPLSSSGSLGLHFQVYSKRFGAFFGLSQQAVDSLLPQNRKPYQYDKTNEDLKGYDGFFKDEAEVNQLVNAMSG